MKNLTLIQITILIGVMVSCVKPNNTTKTLSFDKIEGVVQKGPYLNGSSITMSELSQDLVQTGKLFSSQILDNEGAFELKSIELTSQFVELKANGFYFNEIRGASSTAQLTLYALSDLTDKSTLNVNVLSNLEKRRVEYLVSQELTFNDAKEQAQSEILMIFNISNPEMRESELLDITKTGEDNAILLAISIILQGERSEAELSELLANLSSDFYEDGALDNDILKAKLFNSSKILDLEAVRENLENRIKEIGSDAVLPDFEQYVINYRESQNPFNIETNIGNVSCMGLSDGSIYLTIKGGTPPYEIAWSNGMSTVDIDNLAAGDYSYTISDNSGYTTSNTLTITEPEELRLTAELANSNIGNSDGSIDITVVGGTPPYTYLWSNSETTEDINKLGQGRYIVTIHDSNSCEYTASWDIWDTYTDSRDGTIYKTVKIGDQIWMAENLNIGSRINAVVEQKDNTILEKYCYNNLESNCDIYGGLYQWNEMMQFSLTDNGSIGITQGICPSGWHIPTDQEWTSLVDFLTSHNFPQDTSVVYPGEKMRVSGSNSSGFSALMGGEYVDYQGFGGLERRANWWTSTENFDVTYVDTTWAYYRALLNDQDIVFRQLLEKHQAHSVRCIKD